MRYSHSTMTALAALMIAATVPARADITAACAAVQDEIQTFLDGGEVRGSSRDALNSIHETLGRNGLSEETCGKIRENAAAVMDLEDQYRARQAGASAENQKEVSNNADADGSETQALEAEQATAAKVDGSEGTQSGESATDQSQSADASAGSDDDVTAAKVDGSEGTQSGAAPEEASLDSGSDQKTAGASSQSDGTETAESQNGGADQQTAKAASEATDTETAANEDSADSEQATAAAEEAAQSADADQTAQSAETEEAADATEDTKTAAASEQNGGSDVSDETAQASAESEATSDSEETAQAAADGSEAVPASARTSEDSGTMALDGATVGSLLGRTVFGVDGEELGEVDMVVTRDGAPYVIVASGGFLGLAQTEVGIEAARFQRGGGEDELVLPDLTESDLEAMADWDEDSYPEAPEDATIGSLRAQ